MSALAPCAARRPWVLAPGSRLTWHVLTQRASPRVLQKEEISPFPQGLPQRKEQVNAAAGMEFTIC